MEPREAVPGASGPGIPGRRPSEVECAELLERVLSQMRRAGRPLFLRDFDYDDLRADPNNLATRMSIWARQGLVREGPKGKHGCKSWEPGEGQPEPAKRARACSAEVVGVSWEPLLGQQIVTIRLPAWPALKLHDRLPFRLPRTS